MFFFISEITLYVYVAFIVLVLIFLTVYISILLVRVENDNKDKRAILKYYYGPYLILFSVVIIISPHYLCNSLEKSRHENGDFNTSKVIEAFETDRTYRKISEQEGSIEKSISEWLIINDLNNIVIEKDANVKVKDASDILYQRHKMLESKLDEKNKDTVTYLEYNYSKKINALNKSYIDTISGTSNNPPTSFKKTKGTLIYKKAAQSLLLLKSLKTYQSDIVKKVFARFFSIVQIAGVYHYFLILSLLMLLLIYFQIKKSTFKYYASAINKVMYVDGRWIIESQYVNLSLKEREKYREWVEGIDHKSKIREFEVNEIPQLKYYISIAVLFLISLLRPVKEENINPEKPYWTNYMANWYLPNHIGDIISESTKTESSTDNSKNINIDTIIVRDSTDLNSIQKIIDVINHNDNIINNNILNNNKKELSDKEN